MAPERRKQIVLAVLVVVLLGSLYRAFNPTVSAPAATAVVPPPVVAGTAAAAPAGRGGRAGRVAARGLEAPDVHLEQLQQDRIKPGTAERNLFRFRPRVVAASAPTNRLPPPPAAPVRPAAPAAPTVPPITLKFIGVVEATEKSQTFAVLRDDRGVYHGREGDIIEGRYRILRIGAESIELSYVDGQGRQTIRLGS